MLCQFIGHRPDPSTVQNAGRNFSRCRNCAKDLVEHESGWTSAPKGFQIVWKNAPKPPAPEAAGATDRGSEAGSDREDPSDVAPERRRGLERRRPGGPSTFGGPDRRSGRAQRRDGASRSGAVLERGNVRITRETASFGDTSFEISEVQEVEVATAGGENSLTWLLYALLAAITAAQAAGASEPSLAALAGALAIMALVTWQKRQTPASHSLVLRTPYGKAKVYQSSDWAEIVLLRDAVTTAMPA